MEQLTKLILNNKIVEMRNAVKQSRIQSINKLVKEIKKLRDKKGTEEQKIKNTNKADRFHECIQIMKKVKDDDVSKFALMNEKSLAQITNNVDESSEIKAIARIADHRPLYLKVKAFREKYPDWKETLPLLFDTLGERYQEKKKQRAAKSKPNNNSTKAKMTENKTKNTSENQKTPSNVTYIESKIGTWRVEEMKPKPSQRNAECARLIVQNNDNKSDTKKNKSSNDKIDSPAGKQRITKVEFYEKLKSGGPFEANEEENRKVIVKEDNIKESSKENENPTDRTKVARTVDPFFVAKDSIEYTKNKNFEKSKNNTVEATEEENRKEIVRKSSKENENPIDEQKVTKIVDPFFVTKDNKEYLSVNVVSNATNVEEKKPPFTPTKPKTDFSKPKPYEKNTKQSKVEFPKKYSKIELKEEKLHPSWEAKRKQTSITKFEGKKIKFDD